MHRKIGAPGGSGIGSSPLSRGGPTTSSYRPLTRPNVDPRNAAAPNRANLGVGPQGYNNVNNVNINGKRPPLSDVTNGLSAHGGNGNGNAAAAGFADLKRQRFSDEGLGYLPQQQQQQQQQQR